MTKTQALQRLYKALTGNEGRNTGSKVIEDLAIAAENGEIGGGGKVATVTFVISVDEEDREEIGSINTPRLLDDRLYATSTSIMEFWDTGLILPIIQDGAFILISTNYSISTSGDIELLEDEIEDEGVYPYLVTGDATITISA